jgi:hypothetical protein
MQGHNRFRQRLSGIRAAHVSGNTRRFFLRNQRQRAQHTKDAQAHT